jgi:serine/threonine-protein kinase
MGRLSVADAVHIVLKTALALKQAHEKGLIHRDIKPDNLLLTTDGVVKVADLGLAKDFDDVSLTRTGTGAGTPTYMAPEQARNVKHVDARVDIYAMGVMLYVFLTGQPPFPGKTLIDVITAKERGKFEPIRKYNKKVPAKLDAVVAKMIARDPDQRFPGCDELIDALEDLELATARLSFFAAPSDDKDPAAIAAIVTEEFWYWNLETPQGKVVTKKLTAAQVRTLIKSKSIDADAQVSKSSDDGFADVSSFAEFERLFRSKEKAPAEQTKGKKAEGPAAEKEKSRPEKKKKAPREGPSESGSGSGSRRTLILVGVLVLFVLVGAAAIGGWFLFTNFF